MFSFLFVDGESFAAQAQLALWLCARLHIYLDATPQRGLNYLSTKQQCIDVSGDGSVKVVALARELVVGFNAERDVQVSAFASVR